MLAILGEYRQNRLNYDHLKTNDLPYKPLYFSPGSKRFELGTKYSDMIVAISAFSCLYLGHYSVIAYISVKLKFVNSGYFKVLFRIRSQDQNSLNIEFRDVTIMNSIGTISAFNCLYLGHYLLDRVEMCQ